MPGALRRVGDDPRTRAERRRSSVERARARWTAASRSRSSRPPTADCTPRRSSAAGSHRPAKWRHFATDAAIRRGWLPIAQVRMEFERTGQRRSRSRRFGPSTASEIAARRPAHGRGGSRRRSGEARCTRASGASRRGAVLTPAFQDPRAPIHPYASCPSGAGRVARLGMYVVEPAGWKSAADPIARDAIFEHLRRRRGDALARESRTARMAQGLARPRARHHAARPGVARVLALPPARGLPAAAPPRARCTPRQGRPRLSRVGPAAGALLGGSAPTPP